MTLSDHVPCLQHVRRDAGRRASLSATAAGPSFYQRRIRNGILIAATDLQMLQCTALFDTDTVLALTWLSRYLWPPYGVGQVIIFSSCGFFFLLFSSPNLSRRRSDVYHTSTYGVALVRI